MTLFVLFISVCFISFMGSIHPGPVNLAVVQATLSHSRRAGFWLALGGSLPEIGYSGLAAGGLALIPSDSIWLELVAYASIPVLLVAGIVAFRQKEVPLATPQIHGKSRSFWRGMVLGGTNPQLLPFWAAVWVYLGSHTLVSGGYSSQGVFVLGAACGAFVLLILVAWLADKKRQRIVHYMNGKWINRLTGGLFIGMALWQSIRLIPDWL